MDNLRSLRSRGTIDHRREQLEWNAATFRILSIDGGGIKGILPAAVLAECERRFLNDGSVAAYFDMLAGTSTGGIIAVGLGAGLHAAEVLDIYLTHGPMIFPNGRSSPFALCRKARCIYEFSRNWVVHRYDREPLERVLKERFGERTLGSVDRRLIIPTFDHFNEVNVLKTPHHPDFILDCKEELVTVALATSAAPTFFPTYQNGIRHFADGGIWANNPIMVALIDALTCFEVDRHTVDILSLGCGEEDLRMSEEQINHGGRWHWRNIIKSAMHLQSQNALGQAGLLIGRDRLLRLTTTPTMDPIDMDDYERARAELPRQAQRLVEENAEQLEAFFDTERDQVTFYHGEAKAEPR